VPREKRRPHVLPPGAVDTPVEVIEVLQRPVAVVLLVLQDIPSLLGATLPPPGQQTNAPYFQHFPQSVETGKGKLIT